MRRSSRPSKTTSARAGSEDVALFCYSGHGSQERRPKEFWPIDGPPRRDAGPFTTAGPRAPGTWPTRSWPGSSPWSRTTVPTWRCCWTAVTPAQAPATRSSPRRRCSMHHDRPAAAAVGELPVARRSSRRRPPPGTLGTRPSGWDAAGRHVLLAACRDDEEAKEYQGGGATRVPSPTSWARPCAGQQRRHLPRPVRPDSRPGPRPGSAADAPARGDRHRGPFSALPGRGDPPQPPVLCSQFSERLLDDRRRTRPRHPCPAPGRPRGAGPVRLRGHGRGLWGPGQGPLQGEDHPVLRGNEPDPNQRRECRLRATAPLKAVIIHLPTPCLKVKVEGDTRGVELAWSALSARSS